MFCNTCKQNPCRCVGTGSSWVIQACQHPGCSSMIRVRAGEQSPYPICKRHKEEAP